MYARTHRPLAGAAIVLAAVIALGACGSSDNNSSGSSSAGNGGAYGSATTKADTTTTTAAPAAGGASTVKLSAAADGSLTFDKKTLTAKAGEVTLDMANPGSSGLPHAIAVEGNGVDKDGPTAQPGGSSKVTATLKPGTYTFYCPVPGHKAAGMEGTLTVS